MALEAGLQVVRVAYLLSCEDATPPVLLPVWRSYLDPLSQGSYVWSDPQRAALRTPTQLSEDDADRWLHWLNLVSTVDLTPLDVAIGRFLRAASERQDQADALIDTVIVWEALFGARTEAVLRVSASMARLLEPPGPARDAVRKEIADFYSTRSTIVHGGKPPTPDKLVEASRRSLRLTIDVFRRLVEDRPDLIAMKSEDRSGRIISE